MAPADKKKAKANSKSKAPAIPQESILDLLTKKKAPVAQSDEAAAGEDANRAEEGSTHKDSIVSAVAADPGAAILPVVPLSEIAIPKTQKNGLKGKGPRKKQKLQANAASGYIMDITDKDSRPHQLVAGPSKLAPSGVTRATYKPSIRAEASSQTSPVQSSDGGTRHDPIVLDSSSPIKPQIMVDLTKPTYSIFAPRGHPPQLSSPSKSKLGKVDNKPLETPFPNADSQHVRGSQSEFKFSPLNFGRHVRMEEIIDVDQVSTPLELSGLRARMMDQDNQYSPLLGPMPVRTIQLSDRDQYIKTIPDEHISAYPAISHLVQYSIPSSTSTKPPPSQDLWTDKWRPQRADHVLGNKHYALYLRDWLSVLELQLKSHPQSPQKPQLKSKLELKASMQYEAKDTNKDDDGNKGVKRTRPRVVRAVNKMRRRKKQRVDSDEEEDWIVNTDDEEAMEEDKYVGLREESEDHDEDEDDVEFCRKQTLSRLRRIESSPAPAPSSPPSVPHVPLSASDLHNTLLLAGPPGSGKTAAVYACAKELDWDVFEVYPGVGRRSGLGLDQLVGEVGKNHLVRKAGGAGQKDTEGKKNAFMAMFEKGKEKAKVDPNVHGDKNDGTEGGPIEVDERTSGGGGKHINEDFGFLISNGDSTSGSSKKEQTSNPIQGVRQSLILFEEVDVLFEEDRGFWTAVINIIKDCRRPVIMTCNDISLVPTSDLPLQSILFFQSCPPPVMTSYLQGLCLVEGCFLDRSFLLELCESTRRMDTFDIPDTPLNPLTGALPVPDLRRAIHRLQLWASSVKPSAEGHAVPSCEKTQDEYLENLADWCNVGVHSVASTSGTEKQLRIPHGLISHVETLSFIDSYLTRMPLDMPEALVFNDHEPSPDDEIGHTHLFNASGDSSGLSSYYQDEIIYEDAIRHSRGILEANPHTRPTARNKTTFKTRALFRARVEYQSKMLDLLWPGLVPPQSHLLPRPAVFLDYVPCLRYMALIDDAYELAGDWEGSVNPRSGRPIRNSARVSYERQLTLSDHQREIIAGTRLDGFGSA